MVYLVGNYHGERQIAAEALLARLGPHTTGKACLYLKRLDMIDMDALETLVLLSWEAMWERWLT